MVPSPLRASIIRHRRGHCGWFFWPATGVALQPLGDAFIKLVKMIIAPVIFLTITTGIAGMRAVGDIGRVVGKAFAYFLSVSTLALVVGLLGIDRFMSECRALTNFIGNAVATVVVARWEGALDTGQLASALGGIQLPAAGDIEADIPITPPSGLRAAEQDPD